MGGVTAPVLGPGSCPTWRAFVANRMGLAGAGLPGRAKRVCFSGRGPTRGLSVPAGKEGSLSYRKELDHVDPGDDPLEGVLLPHDDGGSAAQEEPIDGLQVRPWLHEREGLLHHLRDAVVV